MRVHLAGPMKYQPEFNFPAFIDGAEVLRKAGHEVFSPAEHDKEMGLDPTGMTGYECLSELGFSLRVALGADLEWITGKAEAVVLLPGWEDSAGAKAEIATANALGLIVKPIDVFLGKVPDTSPRESVLREATALITGDRNNFYGPPTQDFKRSADALQRTGTPARKGGR